jgi:heat-inducible transcriptional repressor
VRHLEIVRLSETRLMIVLITDTGRVEQRVVELPGALTEDQVADLRTSLNAQIAGYKLSEAAAVMTDLPATVPPDERPNVVAVVATVLETLVERGDERVVLAGTANLARGGALDFPGTIRPVLEALEEHVILLRLLGEADDPRTVHVSIGGENPHEGLQSASVVTTGYGADAATAVASLGIIGPTRMDYPGAMGAVRAVARYVGQILAEA